MSQTQFDPNTSQPPQVPQQPMGPYVQPQQPSPFGPQPPAPKNNTALILWIVGGLAGLVILLMIMGVGGYFVYLNSQSKSSSQTSTSTSNASSVSTAQSASNKSSQKSSSTAQSTATGAFDTYETDDYTLYFPSSYAEAVLANHDKAFFSTESNVIMGIKAENSVLYATAADCQARKANLEKDPKRSNTKVEFIPSSTRPECLATYQYTDAGKTFFYDYRTIGDTSNKMSYNISIIYPEGTKTKDLQEAQDARKKFVVK
jgi:hypothetical protein